MTENATTGPAGASARRRRTGLTSLKSLIAYALIAYTVVAVTGQQLARDGEWFPVFSWSLFTEVSAYGFATRLEIVAIDGQALDPPAFYRDLGDVFPKAGNASISLNKLLDKIALDHHLDAPNDGRLRQLAATYLAGADEVEWRIVRLVTNPIAYYRSGAVAKRYVWLEGASSSAAAE